MTQTLDAIKDYKSFIQLNKNFCMAKNTKSKRQIVNREKISVTDNKELIYQEF